MRETPCQEDILEFEKITLKSVWATLNMPGLSFRRKTIRYPLYLFQLNAIKIKTVI